MKEIKLTQKESEQLTKNIRKHLGEKAVPKEIKTIKFHKEFDKGMRLYLCLNCGYPSYFCGFPMVICECKKPRKKIYELKDLDKFILKLQDFYYKRRQIK